MTIMESAPDLTKITAIAEQYRAHIEQAGYEKLVGHALQADGAVYRRFEGMCNRASRALAKIYCQNGFGATTRMMSYCGTDLTYWQTRGSAFYSDQDEFDDAEPWEHCEDHEVVLIGDVIVDVTSDQFNPEHPEQHRVVVTRVGDRRYL